MIAKEGVGSETGNANAIETDEVGVTVEESGTL
jgi:hypothetical protein